MSITAEQRKSVKGRGFLSNKGGEHFSVRIITENGVLQASQLKNLAEVAEKFGNGEIAFTSRLTVELPGIKFDDIENVVEYVAMENMVTGGTGAKVRPVVACKGTVCSMGNIDTQGLATEIHKRFYEGYGNVVLPHKFKIAIGGCPNNCVKPDLNDLGITGIASPNFNIDLCKGCAKCSVIDVCPMKACTLKDGILEIDKEICNDCGMCVGKCNFKAIPDGNVGYKVYIGGRWGKQIRIGSLINKIFTKDEALNAIEKSILLFKEQGLSGERFSTTIERIGLDNVETMLISDEVLKRKETILGIQTVGGAKC